MWFGKRVLLLVVSHKVFWCVSRWHSFLDYFSGCLQGQVSVHMLGVCVKRWLKGG